MGDVAQREVISGNIRPVKQKKQKRCWWILLHDMYKACRCNDIQFHVLKTRLIWLCCAKRV